MTGVSNIYKPINLFSYMAKKKVAKRAKVSKRPVKKVLAKTSAKVVSSLKSATGSRGLRIAVRNLILFAIIFVISIVIYSLVNDDVLNQFFLMMSFLSGFVAVAFLVVALVFLFLKIIRRK